MYALQVRWHEAYYSPINYLTTSNPVVVIGNFNAHT